MGTDVNGLGPFSPSDVDPLKFGSGGKGYAPSQGYTAAPQLFHQILQRLGYALANTAALQATVEADRKDGMMVVTLDTYTLWVWRDASTDGTSSTVIEPTDTAAGSGSGRWEAVATTAQTLSQLGIQTGTSTLVNGVSPNVSATIGASTRIQCTRTAVNASTAIADLTVTNKTNGSPGHFVVTALRAASVATETGDESSFDWIAIG